MKFSGVVTKHNGRGHKFGFPTANISVPLESEEGIFVGWTYLEGKKLPSVIFVGVAETVGETVKKLESYILDFPDRDLYGHSIEVELLHKLRDNQKFNDTHTLIEQMRKDELQARAYFKKQ